MAVNLSKNGTELMAAYEDVLDGKSGTNWVLFTYEGNSNDIRLAEKGDGGPEEMVEEFNSGKVMYAFCRVEDPNSGLPKYVLINWTGEGVNSSRKGICANHVSSMANFLKGAHVTINARDEDDVEPKVILDKVAKASGASFNFHKHKQGGYVDVPRGPVGSVYRKINAVEEIQQINKDDFWVKAQKDEDIRKREEIKRADQEQQLLEKERKEMEERQSREREARAKERAKQVEQEKMHQKQREQEEREREQQRRTFETKEEKRTGISHAASVQKANEAKSLISQRSFNPRDIFKQREQSFDANNSTGPAVSRPGKLQSPFMYQKNTETTFPERSQYNVSPAPQISLNPEPARSSRAPAAHSPMSYVRPPSSERDYSPPQESSPMSSEVRGSQDLSADAAYNEEGEWSDEFDDDVDETAPDHHDLYEEQKQVETDEDLYENVQYTSSVEKNHAATSEQGICARALYDYQAADDTEITFDPDDIITGIEMIDEGWWRGFGPDGQYGMFPSNYVDLL